MYSSIYDVKKLLQVQLENEEITKDDLEIINHFWEALRYDFLTPVKKRSLWIPHIGEFKVKRIQLNNYIINRIIRIRNHQRREWDPTRLVLELKNALIIRNEIAKERYNLKKLILLSSRKHEVLET